MSRPLSPMERDHAWARRFSASRRSPGGPRWLLRGYRGVKYPMMALLVRRELGSCRHALAQRVVAGTMTVHFPLKQTTPKKTTP